MVKLSSSGERQSERNDQKYKGVRKRKWGKWVSEIRLPNSRERIWLGSYDSPEKAARAFDAALFCLRGNTATFNFPDNPPIIPGGRSLTPAEIQAAAASFANSEGGRAAPPGRSHSDDNSSTYSSTSTDQHQLESPSHSVSDCATNRVNPLTGYRETTTTTVDSSFIDHFSAMGSSEHTYDHSTVANQYEIFPGFDDHFSNDFNYMPSPLPNYSSDNYAPEENYDGIYTQEASFLWNFER